MPQFVYSTLHGCSSAVRWNPASTVSVNRVAANAYGVKPALKLISSRPRAIVRLRATSGRIVEPPEKRTFLPLIGETIEIAKDPLGFFEKLTAEYGPVFMTHFAGEECIAVTDAQLINSVLGSEHKTVVFDILPSMDKVTSSPLFASNKRFTENVSVAKEHKADRKFLSEFFTPSAIASYYPYMQSSMERRIAMWGKEPQVQLLKETKAFAFDVMNTLLAGVEFDKAQLEELDDLWVDFTNGGLDMLGLDLPFTDLGKGMAASARIKTIIADALVKAYGPDTNTREYDGHNIVTGLLRMKADDGSNKFSYEDVAEIMRAILFAGHETTAGSMCIMMHFVTKHPEVLDNIRAEQAELREKYGDELTPEIMAGTYTEATVVEVMRLMNISEKTRGIGVLFRRVLCDFELGGKLVKKGSKLLLAGAFATYQVQDFLATKDEFMPERWLIPGKSSIASSKTKGVSAFGSGPRVCAGEALAWAEMKVFMSMVARHMDWEIVNPDAEWKRAQGSVFVMPVDGMITRCTRKESSLPL